MTFSIFILKFENIISIFQRGKNTKDGAEASQTTESTRVSKESYWASAATGRAFSEPIQAKDLRLWFASKQWLQLKLRPEHDVKRLKPMGGIYNNGSIIFYRYVNTNV